MNPEYYSSPEFRLKQRIEEFQSAISLPEYDGVIEKIIKKAKANQMEIAYWPNSDRSKARAEKHGGYIIFIKGKPTSGNRKELIFDMLHEMGHCFDEIKLAKEDEDNDELVLGRETRAWAIADDDFKNYAELQADWLEYQRYKDECLLTYQIDKTA